MTTNYVVFLSLGLWRGTVTLFRLGQIPSLLLALGMCILMTLSSSVSAQTFRFGEFSGFFNLEAAYGLRFRLDDQDDLIIGANKGGSGGINDDDGNLNYNSGIVANMLSIKPELTLNWENVSMFVRGYAFYDFKNASNDLDWIALSDEAMDDTAYHAGINEAYLSVNFLTGPMPTRLRLGKQTINWGQSTFFQGVNVINPVDLPLFSHPAGTNADDLLIGQNMVWGLISFTPRVSFEAFYQFDWQPSNLHSQGTYFSSTDAVEGVDTFNGQQLMNLGNVNDRAATDVFQSLGLGSAGDCAAMNGGAGPQTFECLTPGYQSVPIGRPVESNKKHGDWGMTLSMIIPELNDTNFGFHFARYTTHAPIFRATLADWAGLKEPGYTDPLFGNPMLTPYTPSGVGQITEELLANGICGPDECAGPTVGLATHWGGRTARGELYYPEEQVDLYGLSWNTTTRKTGTALGGEMVYQDDVPMQVHASQILWNFGPTVASPQCNVGDTVNGVACAPLELRQGAESELVVFQDTFQLMLSAVQLLPPGILGADTWSLGVEGSWFHIIDLPDKPSSPSFCSLRPDQRPDPSEVTLLAVAGTQFGECDASKFAYVGADSWGYRAFATARWSGVFGLLGMTPRFVFKDDVSGYAPNSQFVEGRKELTLGLKTSFQRSASVDIAYTTFWGGGKNNLLQDRDYLSVVFKYEY